jgi:hypothetical protein
LAILIDREESTNTSSGLLMRMGGSAVIAIVGKGRHRIESMRHATIHSWLKNTLTILVIQSMRTKNLLHSQYVILSDEYVTIRFNRNQDPLATTLINESSFCSKVGDGSVRLVVQTGKINSTKGN